MTMNNPKLMTANRIPEALSNLCFGGSSVMDLYDAVEASDTAEELVRNINALDLLRTFSIDRETAAEVRLKSVDYLGNVSYLIVTK